MRCNPKLLLLLSALILGQGLRAQEYTDTRNVRRVFAANLETTVEVENKYGKIQVVTWDKDSVAIEVTLRLSESSSSKLRKLKEDVSIDFSSTSNYILAKTVIESESGLIARELRNVTSTLTGSNKRMEINYTVRVPSILDVALNNKFGDIYLDDMDGQVDINLSNGMLKAGRLKGNSSIVLSFADGMIKSLGSCTMELSYSDLVMEEVSQLDLDSKSSELNVDSVNVVKINSRRDKLNFKRAEYLYGNGNFTQVRVYDFLKESDLYMKYGELTIEHVMPRFSKIYVESDYTDVSLYLDPESVFVFDILHHEKTILRLPDQAVVEEDTFDGKEHFQTSGYVGEVDQESAGVVNIDALQKSYINISVK
jgi:hypothetical protein